MEVSSSYGVVRVIRVRVTGVVLYFQIEENLKKLTMVNNNNNNITTTTTKEVTRDKDCDQARLQMTNGLQTKSPDYRKNLTVMQDWSSQSVYIHPQGAMNNRPQGGYVPVNLEVYENANLVM